MCKITLQQPVDAAVVFYVICSGYVFDIKAAQGPVFVTTKTQYACCVSSATLLHVPRRRVLHAHNLLVLVYRCGSGSLHVQHFLISLMAAYVLARSIRDCGTVCLPTAPITLHNHGTVTLGALAGHLKAAR
jgi:hypothetical protein